MRRTVSPVAAMVAMLAASPARGQTYDPAYPICPQVYGVQGGYIAYGYMSMDQCRFSASGRAAQCIVNRGWGERPGVSAAAMRRCYLRQAASFFFS